MIRIPSNEQLLLEVGYGVGQCILGIEQPFVGGNLARHFTSVGGGPQYLDGRWLARAILDWVLWQTLVVELDPFRIPVKGRLVNRSE